MPADAPDPHARIDALERRVASLERELAARRRPLRQRVARTRPPWMRWGEIRSEDVVGKAGIALLLIGVLFLLRYALDLALLTPALRVAGAGLLGAGLLAGGLRLSRRGRPTLGRLLSGGGLATLYGTLWAASQLYGLLPTAVAFAALLGVAALGLGLASRQADAALAVVATLGGLLTPLLLPRAAGLVVPLVAYVVLLVAGASAVYARRGWSALLGATALGGWAAMAFTGTAGSDAIAPRIALTVGTLAVALATGGLPVWRARASAREPERWPPEPGDVFATWPSLVRPFALAVLAAPLFAFGLLDAVWDWPSVPAGFVALGLAAGCAAAAQRFSGTPALFEPFVLAAAALASWAVGRWVGGSDARTLAAVVGVACVVVRLGRREGRESLMRLGHGAALWAGLWLLALLAFASDFYVMPLARPDALALGTAALGAAGALGAVGLTARPGTAERLAYTLGAHLVVLAWLRALLGPLADGALWVSVAWAVWAVLVLVAGLRMRDDLLRPLGLWTVLATAGKVLAFDLDAIAVPWRIALFLGLGALLLGVSYFAPSLLRISRSEPEEPT